MAHSCLLFVLSAIICFVIQNDRVNADDDVPDNEKAKDFLLACRIKHCKKRGWCVVDNKELKCNCIQGFYGDKCEKSIKKVCENGRAEWNSFLEQDICVCMPGYGGENCDQDLVKENTCQLGESIWSTVYNKAICICESGYGGEDCSIDLSEEITCGPQGKKEWSKEKNEAICICEDGFGGHNCTTDLSEEIKCGQQGKKEWSKEKNEAICVCEDGFGGHDCLSDLSEEITCGPKGKKEWSKEKNEAICICEDGFGGHNCTTDFSEEIMCGPKGTKEWSKEKNEAICVCEDGFGGHNCTTDLSTEKTCGPKGNKEWNKEQNKALCICEDGFGGHDCLTDMLQNLKCGPEGTPKWSKEKNEALCICNDGFRGESCTEDVCKEIQCTNAGVCKWNPRDEIAECICDLGYGGSLCDINFCQNKTCNADNGDCRWNVRKNTTECICHNGFTGNECEKDPCEGKTCGRNGRCQWNDDKNGIECRCQNGFSGTECEIDPCEGMNCSDHGECKWNENKNSAVCVCDPGFIGDECERPACDDDSCNNRGECAWNEITKEVECSCSNGYFGKFCEDDPCDGRTCSDKGRCEWNEVTNTPACICTRGYAGTECELYPCKDKNCSGNGECDWNKEKNVTECICNEGFDGPDCEIDYCEGKICSGNGKCKWNKEIDSAECVCNKGFGGTECETDLCVELSCVNGTCNSSSTEVYCECNRGFSGLRCDVDICEKKNCTKNGKCELVENGAVCKCFDGFSGEKCEKDLCKELSCVNGACISNSTEVHCECNEGYKGPKCDVDICEEKNCTKNGKCELVGKGAVCKCSDGFAGEQCEKEYIDFCATNPCMNTASCSTNGTDYSCECDENYEGKNCTESIWCKKYPGMCGKATCKFDLRTGIGFCDCESKDKYFEKGECKKITKCTQMIIDGKCSGEHNLCINNECKCVENYKLEKDNNCITNFCSKITCRATEKCKELGGGNTICICKDGYYFDGSKCKKTDLCSLRSEKCQQKCVMKSGECDCFNGYSLNEDNVTCTRDKEETACNLDCGAGVCIKTGDTEKCVCPSATHLNINDSCVDICTAKRLPKETCPQGLCIPDEKYGFICNCSNPLYKQGNDGIHCEKKLMCTEGGGDQECAKFSAKCVEDPRDKNKGYACICDKDSEKDSNGECINKCKLRKYRDKCEKLFAVCVLNSNFEPVCKCPPLLSREHENQPCNVIEKNSYIGLIAVRKNRYVTVKSQSEVVTDRVKLIKELEESLQHVYQSIKDIKLLNYTEDETDTLNCVVEMQLKGNPDKEQVNQIASPSVCVSLDEKYCWVKPFLVMKKVPNGKIFEETDACKGIVKERLCGTTTNCTSDEKKSFQCTCKHGFAYAGSYNPTNDMDTFIQKCEDIDECLDLTNCPHRNSSKCLNTYGSYECLCDDGYRPDGKYDIETTGCIPVCNPNPCAHGSCIQVGSNGFACNCHGLFSGYLCNTTNDVVLKAQAAGKKQSAIIGGVLGAILLLVILIALALFQRNRKLSKGEKEEYQMHRQQNAIAAMSRLAHRPPQAVEEEGRVERVPDRPRESQGQARPIRIPRVRNTDEEVVPDPQVPSRQLSRPDRRNDFHYTNKAYDH